MKPSTHAIMFYDSPGNKNLVLFTYIKTSLGKDGAALYFFRQDSPVQPASNMEEFDVTVEKHMKKGSLRLIDQSQQHFMGREIRLTDSVNSIKNLFSELTAHKYKEIKIIEEMTYFLD